MKEIKLSQFGKNRGKYVTLVDDEDFEYLNQWNWQIRKFTNSNYAYRGIKNNGKQVVIAMHRVINKTPKGLFTDHIDHNGLNNQKSNLRTATSEQNNQNISKSKNRRSSKYLGVYLYTCHGKYTYIRAQIHHHYKKINLGQFKTEEEAAIAYDKKAKELYGEYANLNFKS